jgi:hypothetical protein
MKYLTSASPIKAAVAFALAGVLPVAALAQNSTSVSATLNLAADTVSDATKNGSAVTNTVNSSSTIGQFDAATGVLLGATLSASFVGTNPSLTLSGLTGGTGSFAENLSLGTTGLGLSVSSSKANAFTGKIITPIGNWGGSANVADASGLVGTGTVAISDVGTVSANRTGSINQPLTAAVGAHSTAATLTYSYLDHSNASFASGTDVNSLSLTAGSGFSVYALGNFVTLLGGNTTLLDGAGFTCSGQCGAFNLGWSNISDMVAGGSAAGTTSMATTVAGNYAATYQLHFTDNTAVGLASTWKTDTLTLDLVGTVTEVPEPGSFALFLAGFAALGAVARRRRMD